MWSAIASLAESVVGIFVDPPEVKAAKVQAKVRKIELNGDWEVEQAKASATSWKDEGALLVFLGIVVACFIPDAQPYVREGFDMLATLPEWYVNMLYMMIAASFGIRLPNMINKIRK